MKNIAGQFKLTLGGRSVTLKSTFGAIEILEQDKFNRSIMAVFQELVATKQMSFSDMISVYEVGMAAYGDTRMTRSQIGEAIFQDGAVNHIKPCLDFLTYCLTGGKESAPDPMGKPD
jgi:hypothetical protein